MKLKCPHCNKDYTLSDGIEGQYITCALCKKPFQVKQIVSEGNKSISGWLILIGIIAVVIFCSYMFNLGNKISPPVNDITISYEVKKSDFGDKWPFTVDSGKAYNYGDKSGCDVLIFEHDGIEYALNGVALGKGYKDIHPIWRIDPTTLTNEKYGIKPTNINIQPMMDFARNHVKTKN